MLKILWKRGEIAPEEQFLSLSTIFYYLVVYFKVKTRIRVSLRDKLLFEITEVEITRFDCICKGKTNKTSSRCRVIQVVHVRTFRMFHFHALQIIFLYKITICIN